jgi:ATP-dependent exoDNAse (exonuclease V) alpha subunit
VGVIAGLDPDQQAVVAVLASDRRLVVVEGAAGAGKTTTLAVTRAALERCGRRLVVVTPTLKAARVAAGQVGAAASTAGWLAYQHGYRWDEGGAWTRLAAGQTDAVTGVVFAGPDAPARLGAGELLLVDEAGMLDQDTARALLTIADEHGARVALIGDRHQLPAVGRGGVLDLAVRWAAPDACLTLDTVHRFTRTLTSADGTVTRVADEEYAQLSLAMRTGVDVEQVFDALVKRGQIRVYASEEERRHALAGEAVAAGEFAALFADTREQVAELNAAVRDRLAAAGHGDDTHTATTRSGQRIGPGDRVVTRRNDTGLQVANRDTWTVVQVATGGSVTVTGAYGQRGLSADYVRDHLELGHVSTVYGVQGETTTRAHVAVSEHTTASSVYVGMTRGRDSNIAHLVADTLDEARDQWAAVFARDRADLGPTHAAHLAEHEAARYARLRPLDDALSDLHAAWTTEADCAQRLAGAEQCHRQLADVVAVTRERAATVPALRQAHDAARAAAQRASAEAAGLEELVSARAADIAATLQCKWDQQRHAARHAARVVQDG